MRAVVTRLFRSPVVAAVATPVPTAEEILIKVTAAALNPTDWKGSMFARSGNQLGCDFSGIVISSPEGAGFAAGDRVTGVGE